MNYKVLAILVIIISSLSLNVADQNMEENSQQNIKVVILHGYGAGPSDHWFQWLKKELQKKSIEAKIIQLPNSSDPNPNDWIKTLKEEIKEYNKNTYVVAHSLGCITFLQDLQIRIKENSDVELGGMVLVSGFLDPLPKLPELNTFVDSEINTESLQKITPSISVIGAKDDPIVPYSHIENLAQRLNAKLVGLEGGGHFLKTDGYDQFPRALHELESIIFSNEIKNE